MIAMHTAMITSVTCEMVSCSSKNFIEPLPTTEVKTLGLEVHNS